MLAFITKQLHVRENLIPGVIIIELFLTFSRLKLWADVAMSFKKRSGNFATHLNTSSKL